MEVPMGISDTGEMHADNSEDLPSVFNISMLTQSNDALAITLKPVMVFLSVLGVLGLIGNSLVCYIFSQRFSTGSQNFLVICLAVFDLHTCLLTIPYEVMDLRFYAFYIFDTDYICKMFKFINVYCNVGSILTLMVIAVDRHRKVCKPFNKQLRLGNIRLIFFVVLIVSLGYSIPCIFLYGYRVFNSTLVEGAASRECSTPDGVSSLYPTIYNGFLLLNFLVISSALTVLYHGILKEVKRRNKRRKAIGSVASRTGTKISNINSNDDELSSTGCVEKDSHTLASVSENIDCNKNQNLINLSPLPDLVSGRGCNRQKEKSQNETFDKETHIGQHSKNKYTQTGKPLCRSTSEAGLSDYVLSSKSKNCSLSSPKVRRKSSDPLSGRRIHPKNSAPLIVVSLMDSTDITFGDASMGFDKKRSPSSRNRRRARHQTTMVAFSVTTMFIFSYLPYLILMISKLVIFKGFDEELSGEGFILYNLFLRSYLINSMCNPIIYGILNSRFRLEVRRLFRNCHC